ncbi:aldo/keto reductase [Klebsiella pneumoniae]
MRDVNRLRILQDVIDRNLRPGLAAEMLGITPRHCSRLLKRYRQSGPLGMNNQSRGRTGNIDHAKMVMNRWLDHWQTHSFGNWAISPLTNPEKIIGFGGLGIRNYDDIVINNLGYRLSTEAWGKGLATEFAIYAIKFGFDVIKLTEISAVVRENHLASQKVLQKSGLRYVKEIHDVKDAPPSLLYSISVDEWLRNEETMEALHDVVKAGKARYIGASSMEAWRFAKMQHTAERNGWSRFITMQPQYNLLYREEEREMLPLCEDQGVGVIPWSPMARGRLTRDWSVTSRRTQNDAFALKMYENAALLDKPVIDVVASIAEKHAVPRAHVAIAWLLSKSVITAPIIGATKPEHLSTAISALDFSLSDAEITELEARYLPHPVDGIIPPLPDTPPSLTPPSAIQNY